MGSEDKLEFFFNGILVQVEHVLTMANLKLKPSLFTPRPTIIPQTTRPEKKKKKNNVFEGHVYNTSHQICRFCHLLIS